MEREQDEGIQFADVIMIVVATPSTGVDERHYDHSALSMVLSSLNKRKLQNKHVVICCTVLPGYCREVANFLIRDCVNTTISYNPEFIAQGDVIRGLLRPDMVLIGEGTKEAGDALEKMYRRMVQNEPEIRRMSPESAEICKLAINCFITTKIAFANMIGDTADSTEGANKEDILEAIGCDSRIGSKCLKPGYGCDRRLDRFAPLSSFAPAPPSASPPAPPRSSPAPPPRLLLVLLLLLLVFLLLLDKGSPSGLAVLVFRVITERWGITCEVLE